MANRVFLLGNLTRDIEVRFTKGGTSITNFGLALNERYKTTDGEWKETVTFVDVQFWGKSGEAFAKFHRKGDRAYIEGKLRTDTWEDKSSGQKRSKTLVVAENFEFLSSKKGKGDDDGGESRSRKATARPTSHDDHGDDDEIPF